MYQHEARQYQNDKKVLLLVDYGDNCICSY